MSEKCLIDAISHYQKDIDRCPNNKERMLRCIKRLYVMPIKVEHLQATGVGRSVNNLREISGEVGDAATALVAKWKAMVTAEDLEEEEDSVSEAEEDEQLDVQKPDDRVSLNNDSSVKDKENIRLNHRNSKPKPEDEKKNNKPEKTPKNVEKSLKDNKHSKHSSKDKDASLKKDSSSKNHSSSSKDKRDKDKTQEKPKDSKKAEHKSGVEKDRKHRDDKDKHRSKDRSKHSSKDKDKDKEGSREKDKSKRSSSSSKEKSHSKDKLSLSQDKESSKRDRSKEIKEKPVKREKRSRSREKEKESRKCEKRKHHDKDRHYDKPVKIKKEKLSSEEEEESDASSESYSESCSKEAHSSDSQDSEKSDGEGSGSDEPSLPESFSKVKIKQEPVSDSESEEEEPKKKKSRHDSHTNSDYSPEKSTRKQETKTISSNSKSQTLKELIKENETKVKKEKVEPSGDKLKKCKVKIEMNQDGSIDSGSGASFADALMGFDKAPSGSPKKKKKKESSSRHSTFSAASGSQGSHSGRSRSPSQASSHRSSPSPAKQDRKSSLQELAKEVPEALLKNRVKLEPLSLDISSTLPEISTNYKPLPSVPARHVQPQHLSEEQMFSIMTSKNQRTKVYSGYKYGQTLSVPSLYSLCIQVLHDNIDGLEYTGGVPFDILKPLLIKLNGEQLLNLEHYNPYLVDDTDDLWKFHCNKTFPKASRDDMETWRETYLRSTDERELKLKRLTANITESMAIKGPARQAKLAYVDSVAKPPRNIARKQAKYGTGSTSPTASTSGASISQIAAIQNQAKKKEIVSKAIVGGFTPATPATEQVPAYNNPATAAKILKKKKAPLMAKALQLIKGNRFKR